MTRNIPYVKFIISLLVLVSGISFGLFRVPCPPGDIDGNCRVDIHDLAEMADNWLSGEGTDANIDSVGCVDNKDFAMLAANWNDEAGPVIINEFMASYSESIMDGDGEFSDWIELRNLTGSAVNIGSWYLTDNENDLTKWRFPAGTVIAPGGFLLVFASNADDAGYPYYDGQGNLHAGFKLDADGEYLAIVAGDGETAVHEFSLQYPKQQLGVSYGLSGSLFGYCRTPTPGYDNSPLFQGVVSDTKFSVKRGFFTSGFDLAISSETEGASIYYTLDGSEPDENTGILYNGPVPITKTSCLRAVATKPGWLSSNIDTQTYLFTADIILQSPTGSPPGPGWPYGSVNGQQIDYGMDPQIVNHPEYGPLMTEALRQVPSLSIVTDLDNLFDPQTGIYVNALGYGQLWERPASFELVYPSGQKGFQVEAGLRIRGGWSRKDACPKHSFRLLFKEKYGDSKLRYPLFEDEGADEFDNIDLRTAQNYSWSFYGSQHNSFLRDVFSRDVQAGMGQPYTRSRYYHLYLNGQYWGLYQTQERSEASFSESYLGGDEEDYDVVKADGGIYGTKQIEVTDGSIDAYQMLWQLANQFDDASGPEKHALYQRMRGRSPDGSNNPVYPKLLDEINVIDYMISVYFTGDRDAPVSAFFGNKQLNNFYGSYNRINPDGFKFFRQDAEHSLEQGYSDRTGPLTVINEKTSYLYFNPQTLNQWLLDFSDYRILFADRVYRHCFNNGPLQRDNAIALTEFRKNQFDMAIIAESARWGDAKTEPPRTKSHWTWAVNNVQNFFNGRVETVIAQFRNKQWYPLVDPPVMQINSVGQFGGSISPGDVLTVINPDTAAGGTVYCTFDGSDPRLEGGAVNPSAVVFQDGPGDPVEHTVMVEMNDAVWKYLYDGSDQGTAWRELGFDDSSWGSGRGQLGFGDGDEAVNIGPKVNNRPTAYFRHVFNVPYAGAVEDLSVDLLYDDGAAIYINGREIRKKYYQQIARVELPAGTVSYDTFATGTSTDNKTVAIDLLEASDLVDGDNVIAVEVHQRNAESSDLSFDLRLTASVNFAGWDRKTKILTETTQVKARLFANGQWSALADAVFTIDLPADSIVINEVLAHSHADNPDWIELYNTTAKDIDISGWFLSDDDSDNDAVMKYEIPANTVINAFGYLVFYENTSFGSSAIPAEKRFGLSEGGEEVHLHSGSGGKVTEFYRTSQKFDASRSAISSGRYEKAELSGGYDFAAMNPTPGRKNDPPLISDIVITEINYNPASGTDYEYVELYNRSGADVLLMTEASTENSPGVITHEHISWRLEGTGFEFPDNTVIRAGEHVIIARDPSRYASLTCDVYGPYDGRLSNGGEQLELQIPGDREYGRDRYWIPLEKVNYDDETPWPVSPDGQGKSLERILINAYGRDYSNWRAAVPSPGS